MISIFDYIDYRHFLKELFEKKKEEDKKFSHRYFANRLELGSSGYMLTVMQGKRNLTEHLAEKIVKLFSMSKQERTYFLLIVNYAHSKSQDEKQFLFEKVVRNKNRNVKDIPVASYQFYEKWYYSAIREAVAIMNISTNYSEVAQMLSPSIKASEVEESLELLSALNLIKKDENGIYKRISQAISTGSEWNSATIQNLQMTLSDLAKESLLRFPGEQREMSNLTLSISQKNISVIKDKIKQLRSEILELAIADREPDSVIQCNFQVFPLLLGNEEL